MIRVVTSCVVDGPQSPPAGTILLTQCGMAHSPYTPIMGTLAYVHDTEHDTVLLVHRNRRADDQHLGKWNGLGGKLESGENLAGGIRRELAEEAGLHITDMRLRGTVSWPGFGPNGEDWFSPIFLITGFGSVSHDVFTTVHLHSSDETNVDGAWATNPEGELHWIPLSRLLDACNDDPRVRARAGLELWEGDRSFLPLVFDGDPRVFHGVMPYVDGRPISWNVERW
jgi:8-oxo-dGTP diphosphatase